MPWPASDDDVSFLPGLVLGVAMGTGFGIATAVLNACKGPTTVQHQHAISNATHHKLKEFVADISTQFKQDAIKLENKDGIKEETKDTSSLLPNKGTATPARKPNSVPFPCSRLNEALKYCLKQEYNNSGKCTLFSDLIKECVKTGA